MVLTIVSLVNRASRRRRELSLSTDRSDVEILETPEAVTLNMTDAQVMELFGVLEKSKELGP